MRKTRNSFLCLSVLLLAGSAFAASGETPATITFSLDFPQSNPEHYEITIPTSGPAKYVSNGALGNTPDPDTTPFEFTISDATRRQIFELAKKAKYYSGKLDSVNTNIEN